MGEYNATFTYAPFGKIIKATGRNKNKTCFNFSTKPVDDTGLVYYGYRFYEPELGRWLNRDLIGEKGGVNNYAFINNKVINKVDLFGLVSGSIGAGFYDLYGASGSIEWDIEKKDCCIDGEIVKDDYLKMSVKSKGHVGIGFGVKFQLGFIDFTALWLIAGIETGGSATFEKKCGEEFYGFCYSSFATSGLNNSFSLSFLFVKAEVDNVGTTTLELETCFTSLDPPHGKSTLYLTYTSHHFILFRY
ncbi:MAG: RHS repeat-associated core domain-containing protein [Verrucomicrobiota bacterium]|nr:RHS repeat-associated core domain-containing protein [Verrucomicrobiota bacterium]